MSDGTGLMDCQQACMLTGLSYTTLAHMRHNGTGPKYVRSGAARIYYSQKAVIDWMAEENRFYADGSFGPDVKATYDNRFNDAADKAAE
ncbi:AlpA family transcriptional regulator [Tropicibacter sp. Alg240-R139]|uniref:helix-turn-helix transcriptional regulator n=1 Tax=Tropicibacter sp. Alg240-R139 TaxID=2305991 RepID=UPI0013DF9613|nr:helix-turn-helix domain-containing protein [Tropicibacter sp. Alg240-R139]